MLGAHGELQAPLVGRDYEAWPPNERLVQEDGQHFWHMGVHVGPNASGEGLYDVETAKCAPPALRKVSVRERMAVLSAPGQVDFSLAGNPAASDGPS